MQRLPVLCLGVSKTWRNIYNEEVKLGKKEDGVKMTNIQYIVVHV